MQAEQFGKPIIAVVNSFTQFVPGHTHLHAIGQIVKAEIEKSGCFAAEFNTIAIDDGIAMGHSGMLYSLPSRDIIADSVEYMCNAHGVDAMICISNCDKITPGMLMAAMRLNIPAVFVSGGPMEAGQIDGVDYDLVDVMVAAADPSVSDKHLDQLEELACPTCGSCSGLFTANSMNSLAEALGLALPGNGTIVATHEMRTRMILDGARLIVKTANDYYLNGNADVLPRSIANRTSFLNAMSLDIAMGGSTNTILHMLAMAKEGEVNFTLDDVDSLSRKIPNLCKVAPSSKYHMQDVNRAGGILGIMAELNRAKLIDSSAKRLDYNSLGDALSACDIIENFNLLNQKAHDSQSSISNNSLKQQATEVYFAAPGPSGRKLEMGSQRSLFVELDTDRVYGCIRNKENAYSQDGGLAILYGNIAEDGCVVKTAGVAEELKTFRGTARIFHSQDDASAAILNDEIKAGDVVLILFEGPKGGPGMQEMLYPTSYLKSKGLDKVCALITDGRFSGGTSGLSMGHVSPEAAAGGNIGLVQDGDKVFIDIKKRLIEVEITKEELANRKKAELSKKSLAFKPVRKRVVSKALQAYAHFVSSADKGATREIQSDQK